MFAQALLTKRGEIETLARTLSGEKLVGIDTEFIREKTFYPQVALLQVSSRNETWLVDPTAFKKGDLDPLLDILKDPNVMKIMHAAYGDQECFHYGYSMLVSPVFDTAIAAALCGLGDNPGLSKLLKELLQVTLPKGRARAHWLARPLPVDLMTYASQDVEHLVPLAEALISRLEQKGRMVWALEESIVDSTAFDITPEAIADRLAKSGKVDPKGYSVLVELLKWREHRAKTANLPRGWVADNEVLIALCKVRPKSLDELRTFRGLNRNEIEREGQNILEAICRGVSDTTERVRVLPRTTIPTEQENHILDFILTYVAYLGAHHEIASRFLLPSDRALSLLRKAERGTQSWLEEGILSQHSFDLIGEDLAALLSGKRALAIRNGKVEVLSV